MAAKKKTTLKKPTQKPSSEKKITAHSVLHWAPRVLAILFTAFVSMFALDVFQGDHGFWEVFVALFMHLIPTFILIAATLLAWRWRYLGALLFFSIGIAYILLVWGGQMSISTIMIMTGPAFTTAILLVLDKYLEQKQK
ncbi:hypothetical protein ACFL2M_00795 [Patescibacteria group bacterium]